MEKVNKIRLEKIWGYEDWIYSPLLPHQTKTISGKPTTKGPLVKIIKTTDKLSVQVHPNDEYTQKVEKQPNGKSECWYVLESKGAPFVLGLKTYDKKKIEEYIQHNEWDKLIGYKVAKPGDFIDVPAGLVHGIPEYTKVLEIQQPSDITYRLFDYNRLQEGKLRELHIDKAIDCIKKIDWNLKPISENPLTYKNAAGKFSFLKDKEKIELQGSAIVVDLKEQIAYIAQPKETIQMKNKCAIIYL